MIYFLYGEDEYQKEKRLKELLKEADEMNTVFHDVFEFNKIYNDVTTQPFLASKKTVVVKRAFDLKKKDEIEKILDCIDDACDLIVIEEKLPAQNTKVAKKLSQKAKLENFETLKPFEIPNWIIKKTDQLGGKIQPSAANLLSLKLGNDLIGLENEIRKLINYNQDITEENINNLTRTEFNDSIFTLMDAISAKNTQKTLKLLNEFLTEPDNESYVLSMISKQVFNMLAVKDLSERKMSEGQITSETGLHPFVVKKTLNTVKNFSFEKLIALHKGLLNIDISLKSGGNDPRLLLTKLLVETNL